MSRSVSCTNKRLSAHYLSLIIKGLSTLWQKATTPGHLSFRCCERRNHVVCLNREQMRSQQLHYDKRRKSRKREQGCNEVEIRLTPTPLSGPKDHNIIVTCLFQRMTLLRHDKIIAILFIHPFYSSGSTHVTYVMDGTFNVTLKTCHYLR